MSQSSAVDRPLRTTSVAVNRLGVHDVEDHDVVTVEEPLAIRVQAGDDDQPRQLAITMRTPGHDHELAVGWLLAEGVLRDRRDVLDVSWCVRDRADPTQHYNAVTVTLRRELPDLAHLDRHGFISSACGVCGRATLDELAASGFAPVSSPVTVTTAALHALPTRLRETQAMFDQTGGLHAAARFTADGDLIALREDVGRHNALDKLVGASLLDGGPSWDEQLLVLSGRASYELLQKAVVARVPIVAALGAPSSLAVAVAERFGITLVGFLRHDRGNVYTHPDRIVTATAPPAT